MSGSHLHGCVLLDVRLPRMNGPELQSALSMRGVRLPIIFLTAYGDVATSVRALRAGALDFLEKPIDGQILLERIRAALETDATSQAIEDEIQRRHERLARLTSRERDVMDLVVRGYSNKNIAKHLGISHRTVEVYRSRVMQKLQVPTLLELVIFAEACGATVSHSAPRMDSGESPGLQTGRHIWRARETYFPEEP